MEKSSSKPSSKLDRKTIEKNRRMQMKELISQLNSLVPSNVSSSKGSLSLPDQVDRATNYIEKLHKELEYLKKMKASLVGVDSGSHSKTNDNGNDKMLKSSVQIELHENGSDLHLVLVTGLDCQLVFTESIRILHEEHVELLNASYTVDGDKVYHNIHAEIGEHTSVARISERLNMYSL